MNPADENKNNEQQEAAAENAVLAETQEKKSKKAAPVKPKESLFAEVKGEFKKIVWPNRSELIKQTTTVIFVSAMFGVIIFLMDLMFGFGINSLIDLIIG